MSTQFLQDDNKNNMEDSNRRSRENYQRLHEEAVRNAL